MYTENIYFKIYILINNLTILFDLDGTIVDTAPDLMAAHNHVMKKFGFHQKKLGGYQTPCW